MDQRSKLNIAVCDDDIFVTEQLSEWIKEYFVSNHLEEPNIYEFDNGENSNSGNEWDKYRQTAIGAE